MIKYFILKVLGLFDFYHQLKIFKFLAKKKLTDFNIFLDIGAHKGESIELFLKYLDIKNIYSFEEKPLIGNINIGFIIFSKESLTVLKKYNKIENFLKLMAKKNLINEFIHKKNRITVNTIEELEIANKKIIKF